jgi:nucleoside-diphosphate-sugar epimerase
MGALRLAITGAGGFLGRAACTAAVARGHEVTALARNPRDGMVAMDLADPERLDELRLALEGCDAVIHCAAALSGDDSTHARDTIGATRQLYEALPEGARMVLACSVSVHDSRATHVSETTMNERYPERRDAYARAKLGQERIAGEAAGRGIDTVLMRLGALWCEGRRWNAHIGQRLGPILLRMDGGGELPLLHVNDAAEALVMAAETDLPQGVSSFVAVGDHRPSARQWLVEMNPEERPKLTLRLPWKTLLPFAKLARMLRLPVPGLLRVETLRYRMAPRVYDNQRAKTVLGWSPVHERSGA